MSKKMQSRGAKIRCVQSKSDKAEKVNARGNGDEWNETVHV